MAKEVTPAQTAVMALQAQREKMRGDAKGIGEPAVEIPIGDLSVFKGSDGALRIIIPMDKLVYLVDSLLRTN